MEEFLVFHRLEAGSLFSMNTFNDFPLHPDTKKALQRMGYTEPTPIQKMAIPLILDGKDLIGLAETGSGKTAACAIPICDRVDTTRKEIQALIVVPTRELAIQYAMETQSIGKEKGVKAFALYGGEDFGIQLSKLRHGVHVLVATPGRLIDLVYKQEVDLSQVETLILDEADEMLSMGFYDDLEFIIQCLIHDHQTLLFSATMPSSIKSIAKQHMQNPEEIVLTRTQVSPQKIQHKFLYCHPREREKEIILLAQEMKPRQAIIFCQSRNQTERVYHALRGKLSQVDFLHGGLGQESRTSITDKFRREKIRYLVATDVAARGLDFRHVTHVFIYQLSSDIDMYLHRAGRTGRHDRHGLVVTLVSRQELSYQKMFPVFSNKILNGLAQPLEKHNRSHFINRRNFCLGHGSQDR